ncbi:hypothetical protein CEP88_16625 [Roseobacter denitrificans]|uniref:Uncharacterized protein n=1 Tax=Roseobacter denitrificans (strain ATCC 33942 / OCh 114) TaxID=375451 RepID=Q16AL6_ROSDO|nr:hypothetical protein [Roseobacter denitrificans]ABG30977.1 hypothetical protein RD1_1335 [Roseobacter denitrificans OCh 114]AVL54058.1 hypothetical protein CEP88_16625 [Roseobacter denitrificans]SFG13208.1 hypothetical protein SAMN05443635_10860 [Roseobacter denitrificans OCh 114]
MEAVFSKEIQSGLDQARVASMKKSSRLRVCADGKKQTVLRMWKTGFAMEADAPDMRGMVDLYDGSIHLFRCLVVTTAEESGERHYEFKRATAVRGTPALDFETPEHAPAGLIEDAR